MTIEIEAPCEEFKLNVGSHNKIIIDKLYGPACVKDLVIVWDGYDWNVRTSNDKLRFQYRELKKENKKLIKQLKFESELE